MDKVKKMQRGKICVSLIFLILVLTGGCSMFSGGKTDEIQKNMTVYLENTYGKEFVVGKPKVSGNEFIGFNNYQADAYPKNQPDLKFGIIWNKNKPGVFQDNYLGTKWSKQGTVEMEKKLREVYGDDFWLEEYWISYNDKKVKDLDYPEIIKQYADRMRVDIRYFVFIDGKMDKKYEAKKMYKILKENLIDLKTMQYYISVGYIAKDKKPQLLNIYSSTTRNDHGRSMPDLHKAGILKNWIGINYTDEETLKKKYPEVKNADEILKKFRIKEEQ